MAQTRKPEPFPAEPIFKPALKFGALTGTAGLLVGGVSGLIRSKTPALFALASSIQCFALGSVFWASRSTIIYAQDYGPNPSHSDRLTASTLAGTFTGSFVGALFRGRRNVIPGAIMFSLFGYVGQTVFHRLDERHTEQIRSLLEERAEGNGEAKKGFWESVWGMKWSPLTKLSDEQYVHILGERLLRIDAEIALVEEEIERVRSLDKGESEKRIE